MSKSFADLGVSERACAALAKRGIEQPFAVQRMVIEDVLAGEDVLVQSPTGSGKTLAFGVPMLERIDAGEQGPTGLVLAPTRELASQIVDELEAVARARQIEIAPVYGGVGFGPQIKRARRAELIVATPGRLEDLLQRGDIRLDQVRILVLDEADRMLDMGFRPAVDRIVERCRRDRQTLFFSATLEGATGKVARDYTNSPRRHVNEAAGSERVEIDHRFVGISSRDQKLDSLVEHLEGDESPRTLVFVRTKRGADRLVKRLGSRNVRASAMHGDKSQSQRRRALAGFEDGQIRTLVATDVAARGIDVEDITHVINYDPPGDHETYTHRVGRTGRAGRSGASISFVLGDERGEMRKMAKALGLSDEFGQALGTDASGEQITALATAGRRRSSGGAGNGNGNGNRGGSGRNGNRSRSDAGRDGRGKAGTGAQGEGSRGRGGSGRRGRSNAAGDAPAARSTSTKSYRPSRNHR